MPDGLLAGNDFFQGGLALMFMGAAIAAIRYAPQLIWHLIQRYWAVSVTTRDQELVRWISKWMAETEYGKNCQWLDAAASNGANGPDAFLRPGFGMHSFKEQGTRYWFLHALEDQGIAGKISVLTLKILGRDSAPLRRVIKLAVETAKAEQIGKNVIYTNDRWGNWERIRLFPNRHKGSLFLESGVAEEMLTDAREFLGGEEYYRVRGLPYRRGYLFSGSPGNGKSTIIQVLATELSLPIYLLSLSDPEMTDYSLARALGQTPERCLFVIEDFEKVNLDMTSMTVAGLLNALDGPLASDGRLLIITANEAGAIQEYYLRPGRIDRRWLIDTPSAEAVEMCYDSFSPDGTVDKAIFIQRAVASEWSMAKVQQELVVRTRHGAKG